MGKPLTVWRISYGRRTSAVAAVGSRAEFVRLLGPGYSDSYVKNFGGETSNGHTVAVAMAMPGRLLVHPDHTYTGIYTRVSDGARFTPISEADGIHVYGLHEFKD